MEDFKRINEQYEVYRKLIEKAKEERLIALVGALSMEEAIDLFFEAYIPGYSNLKTNDDFTLLIKIELVRSLNLIPRHILGAADIVRKCRNEFVHDLSIDSFDSLDEKKFKNKLEARFKELFPDDKNTCRTVKDTFISIVECVVMALGIYASHVRIAREYIYSGDFVDGLIERIKR